MSTESTEGPFRGAFPHQHGDPQSLRERIDAQLRGRIQEALEMAGLETMVEARKRAGRPAPEDGNAGDRDELLATIDGLLDHLHEALGRALPLEERPGFEGAQQGAAHSRDGRLAGQVCLAKRLPDYWQRFEAHRVEFARKPLGGTGEGWLKRLFGS